MALKLNERYPGRFGNPTTAYPQGSFKNRTAPGALDGSYLEKDWANDNLGFLSSLLASAGVVPNGVVDQVGASQYFTALQAVIASTASTPDATEAVKGKARIATQTQTNTGTDDATIVTPKKLRAGFAASIGVNGYITFPTWMGGLIIQWGTGTTGTSGSPAIQNFPISFPNNLFVVIPKFQAQVSATADIAEVHSTSLSGVGVAGVSSGSGGLNSIAYKYIALGN